jgi:DNA-binding MarR family transcriptional regulator
MATLSIDDAIGERSPGRLLRRLGRLLERRIQARFSATDPSFEEWMTLKLVFDGAVENAGDLAREFNIATGATTRLIDSLERQGFVARDRSGADRRVVRLRLTPAGEAYYRAKVPEMLDCWNELFESFEPGEVTQLISLLMKLQTAFPEDPLSARP